MMPLALLELLLWALSSLVQSLPLSESQMLSGGLAASPVWQLYYHFSLNPYAIYVTDYLLAIYLQQRITREKYSLIFVKFHHRSSSSMMILQR
jgi:hypothetical protein